MNVWHRRPEIDGSREITNVKESQHNWLFWRTLAALHNLVVACSNKSMMSISERVSTCSGLDCISSNGAADSVCVGASMFVTLLAFSTVELERPRT